MEERKNTGKNDFHDFQVSILGLLANDPATVSDGQRARLCNPDIFIFEDNKTFWYLVVPLNNFASMSNCPWVQGKSNKPPPLSRCVCVGGGGRGEIVIPWFSLYF